MKNRSIIIIAVTAAVAVIAVAAVAAVLVARGGSGSAYQEHLELADRYIEELEYEQAIAELRAAIEIEPDNSEAYLILSEIYAAMNDHEKALAALQEGYEATGDEVFRERMEELETLRQEYENRQADAQGNDQQNQPGAGTDNTGPSGTETGDTGRSEAEGTDQEQTLPDEEVQIRLRPVIDSLVLLKEPLTAESRWQEVCDRLGIENTEEITDEETLFETEWIFEWLYEGEGEGDTWVTAGAANYLEQIADDILYTCDYFCSGNSFNGDTRIGFYPDGKLYSVYTDIMDSAVEAGADFVSVEGFAGYIYEHQITSIADFLKDIGMEEADPQCVAIAETILDEYQSYEAVYETEYGAVTLHYSMWTLLEYYSEYPHVTVSMVFEEEDVPWGILTIGEYISAGGGHGIYMTIDTMKEEPWW